MIKSCQNDDDFERSNYEENFMFSYVCISCYRFECLRRDISKVKTHDVDSEIYSADDINSAVDTIEKEFDANWNGCTLTEIYYAGDDYCTDFQEFADRNNADEVIVLLSSFDVDSSGGDGSLNPNSTYNNWNWILVRTKGGKWQHIDHGY